MATVPSGNEFLVGRTPSAAHESVAVRALLGTTLAAAVGAVIVAAETIVPLHIRAARTCSAIETAIMLAAVLSAVLLRSQFLRTRRLSDLFLLAGLGTVAWTQVVFRALPALSNFNVDSYGAAASNACALLVTGMLLAAAFVPAKLLVPAKPRLAVMAGFIGVSIVLLGILLDRIAGINNPGSNPIYEPMVMTLAFISFCGLLLTGFGFASRAHDGAGDRWLLAGASYLLAAAALQQLILPLAAHDWVTPAHIFRLIAFALLLVAALRMYLRTRDQAAQEAVSAERVRIARDLHDGLAQDLAFISAQGERLEREFGESQLAFAAQRALAMSREAIVDLEASQAFSTVEALRDVAAEFEARFGVQITVRTENTGDQDVSAADRREIVRIAREAISNAVHHGGAQHVKVTLGSRYSDLLLHVSDDGCGLGHPEAQANPGTGLGMRTMRIRAEALGGHLIARARDIGGTEVSVMAAGSEGEAAH